MTKNKLFDRVSLQANLRRILNTWGDEIGYEIIQSALEKEIHYDEYKKRESQRDRIRVVPNCLRDYST
jgi:hypothetical protein